ncbi:DUF4811 domain-containing protein [Xylocopilactobacillus apicola]|uniref:DUF4811 domain-containing protein n=1 Tax=Xylocopilactobacillus apicola TaxID=2932184 RepID=A0AAU9DEF8_9LACO|nr:DUF4811 domain-containing protein [Xylocopilactobacillus apicola]BDR58260.1 DUF4811 domain-containing protein [Xylocopilactobacillus apicola]
MIILIAAISIIGLFLTLIYIKSKKIRRATITIMSLIVLSSIVLLVMNSLFHFGMVKETKTQKSSIYSTSPTKEIPLLVYQKLDQDLSIYLYKNSPHGKITNTDTRYGIHNRVKTSSSDQAVLLKQTKTWGYQSNFTKNLFSKRNDGEFIEQDNTFKIPKNWNVLSVKQSTALSKKLKPSDQQKVQMQQTISEQVRAARQKNPQMNQAQQQQLIKKITEQIQQDALKKAINEVKSEK